MGNTTLTLRDSAKGYETKKTKNISEIEVVNLDFPIEQRSGIDNEGKEYNYKVAIINGQEYRVPEVVLKDIKTILEAKPTLKTVRVIKKGQGMATNYTVVPLD